MKAVCISDTHGKHYRLNLPAADMLIFAGDCCYLSNHESSVRFIAWLESLDYEHMLIIAGNHDKIIEPIESSNDPRIIYLHNSSYVINGIKFYGTPYTPSFMDWYWGLSDLELKRNASHIPFDTDVLISHGPAREILDENIEGISCGDKYLSKVHDKLNLKYHIFGHIHESYSQFPIRHHDCWCYNV